MSSMEAVYVKLRRPSAFIKSKYEEDVLGMDEFDLSDYESERDLIRIDGELWEYYTQCELEPTGFVKVIRDTDKTKELVVYYYNGGACLDEVVQAAFEKE